MTSASPDPSGTTPGSTNASGHARVLVATDGSAEGTRAVTVAAQEAVRRGGDLEILHVTPAYLPTGPFLIIPDGALQQSARDVLDHASKAAHRVSADLEVTATLVTGGRVGSIAHESDDAGLLVLGARDLTLGERIWTGATVAGATARAGCPVLVIPPGHDPERAQRGRITVGLKYTTHAERVLAAGFDEAESRGAELVVLHAWRLPSGYDDVVSNRVDCEQWEEQVKKVIDDLLVELRAAHPGVDVRVEVTHGQAAQTLVDASRHSDRLYLTKPVHLGYFHHIGATARAVLREALCPIVVVPPVEPAAESR